MNKSWLALFISITLSGLSPIVYWKVSIYLLKCLLTNSFNNT